MYPMGGGLLTVLAFVQVVVPIVTAVAVVVIAGVLARGARPVDDGGDVAVEQRLDQLDRLLASGRITPAERDDARARLLGTL